MSQQPAYDSKVLIPEGGFPLKIRDVDDFDITPFLSLDKKGFLLI